MTNIYRFAPLDRNNRSEFLVKKTLKNVLTSFWDENLTRNPYFCSDIGLSKQDSGYGVYFHIDHEKSF